MLRLTNNSTSPTQNITSDTSSATASATASVGRQTSFFDNFKSKFTSVKNAIYKPISQAIARKDEEKYQQYFSSKTTSTPRGLKRFRDMPRQDTNPLLDTEGTTDTNLFLDSEDDLDFNIPIHCKALDPEDSEKINAFGPKDSDSLAQEESEEEIEEDNAMHLLPQNSNLEWGILGSNDPNEIHAAVVPCLRDGDSGELVAYQTNSFAIQNN